MRVAEKTKDYSAAYKAYTAAIKAYDRLSEAERSNTSKSIVTTNSKLLWQPPY